MKLPPESPASYVRPQDLQVFELVRWDELPPDEHVENKHRMITMITRKVAIPDMRLLFVVD